MVAPSTSRLLLEDVEDDVDSVSDDEHGDVDEGHREMQATGASTCANAIFNSNSAGFVEVR